MARLVFPPVGFAPPFRMFPPEEALNALVAMWGNRTDDAMAKAHYDIDRAVREGELPIYVAEEGTSDFFKIPAEFWQVSLSDPMTGNADAFPSDQVIPASLNNRPVMFNMGEWEIWAAKQTAPEPVVWIPIRKAARTFEITMSRSRRGSGVSNAVFEIWREIRHGRVSFRKASDPPTTPRLADARRKVGDLKKRY